MHEALEGPLAGQFVGADYQHKKVKRFDSQREYKRWLVLREKERQGLITWLIPHPPAYKLHCPGMFVITRYYPDFTYIERGRLVVEDCKGRRDQKYEIKKRWMKSEYGIDIRET